MGRAVIGTRVLLAGADRLIESPLVANREETPKKISDNRHILPNPYDRFTHRIAHASRRCRVHPTSL